MRIWRRKLKNHMCRQWLFHPSKYLLHEDCLVKSMLVRGHVAGLEIARH